MYNKINKDKFKIYGKHDNNLPETPTNIITSGI